MTSAEQVAKRTIQKNFMIATRSLPDESCPSMPGFHSYQYYQTRSLQICEGLAFVIFCILILLTGYDGPRDQGVVFKKGNSLKYKKDQFGNHIPNYSTAGYRNATAIPDIPVVFTLYPNESGEDDTNRIQNAIDEISHRQTNPNGFRGTLLLKKGEYKVSGQLFIYTSGIVLRGEGQFEGGTLIHATGT